MDYSQPLTDEEFRELDEFLMSENLPEDCMDVSMLDGFLTAIVIGPNAIAPDRWMPMVWGETAEQRMPWESERHAKRMGDLVLRHMSDILWAINEDPDNYAPVLYEQDEDGENVFVIDEWCSGFIQGTLLDEAWAPLFDSQEGQDMLLPILLFGTESGLKELEEKPELADRYDEFVMALPECVLAAHDHWLGVRKAKSTIRHEQPAPGRNDPCPCGSGKKFKKCCGEGA